MRKELREGVLAVELDGPYRHLSSAVLGGGLGEMRSWVNAQVPSDYARTDPEAHLAELVRGLGLPRPAVGMLTAALVRDYVDIARGAARAIATVGLRDPLAAASTGITPGSLPPADTINLLILVEAPLSDAALVGAASTAVEAKVQALATAGVRAGSVAATGTATDSLCVACPEGLPGSRVHFAGPATRVGSDLALAVHDAVVLGAQRYAAWCRENRLDTGPVDGFGQGC
jgi:adenosylcobinamide hydrolase